MTLVQPHIRSGILADLEDYLTRRGTPLEKLAQAAGLSQVDPETPLQQMPLNAFMAIFDLAARELGDPAFGLNFAEAMRPGGSGLLGEIILNAPTVREGLVSTANYIRVFMSPFEIHYSEGDGVGRLDWSFPTSVTAPRVQYNMFMCAALLKRVRAATGRDWMPLVVELDHFSPDCPEEIVASLGPRVRFNASSNSLIIDGQTLSKPMPQANAIRFAMMRDLAGRWLAELSDQPEIVSSTRTAIAAMLKEGRPDLEKIAGRIGVSAGALQWRLERAGTTFEQVVTDERRSQAEHFLRNTDKSLTEIAYDLGFSDPSTFTRAANRWFGMSPRAWRKCQRQYEAQAD